VILSGPAATLAALDAADLSLVIDAGGLAAGEHEVAPQVDLPNGVQLVSVTPGAVPIVLQEPVTPSPTPG
jgi:hypothetical protein